MNQELLSEIEAQLKADADWTVKFLVLEATVPVLKAFYIPMKLNCKCRFHIKFQEVSTRTYLGDIVLTNGSGVENTKLMHYIFGLQPEALSLYHFVRVYIHFGHVNFKRKTNRNFS